MNGTENACAREVEIRQVSKSVVWISEAHLTVPCELHQVAAWLHVTPATVRRWCRLRHLPALMAERLRTVALGLLDHAKWVSWSIDGDGRLWSPAGYSFMPAEIEWIGLQRQLNDALRAELDELRAALTTERDRAATLLRAMGRLGRELALQALNGTERTPDHLRVVVERFPHRRAKRRLTVADVRQEFQNDKNHRTGNRRVPE